MLNVKQYEVELELLEDLLGTVPKNRDVYGKYIAEKGRQMLEKARAKGIPMASGAEATDTAIAEAVEQEVETIEEVEERGYTGFHTDPDNDNKPFLYDYALRGFLSEAARTLKSRKAGGGALDPEVTEEEAEDEDETPKKRKPKKAKPTGDSEEVKQLQDKIKRYVFVFPRFVRLPEPGRIEDFRGKPMLVVTDKGIVCERPLRAMTAQGPRVTVVRSDVILAGGKINFELHVLENGLSKAILEDIFAYGRYIGLGQWRSGGWGRVQLNRFKLKA